MKSVSWADAEASGARSAARKAAPRRRVGRRRVGQFPLAFLRVVLRVGKRRYNLFFLPECCSTRMVEMEMRHDDVADAAQIDPRLAHLRGEPLFGGHGETADD